MKIYTMTDEKIREAYKQQIDDKVWNFHDEKNSWENLLQTRFNFLLTTYALFLTAFFMGKDQTSQIICLVIGFVVTALIGLVIYRSWVKLTTVLQMIHKLGPDDVLTILDNEINERKDRGKVTLFGVTRITGIIIPTLLPLSFLAGLVAIFCGHSF